MTLRIFILGCTRSGEAIQSATLTTTASQKYQSTSCKKLQYTNPASSFSACSTQHHEWLGDGSPVPVKDDTKHKVRDSLGHQVSREKSASCFNRSSTLAVRASFGHVSSTSSEHWTSSSQDVVRPRVIKALRAIESTPLTLLSIRVVQPALPICPRHSRNEAKTPP